MTLAAGALLRRVHRRERGADEFNPRAQPTRLAGGRFDSRDGTYAYSYLGSTDRGAIAETICRDLPLDGTARLVPSKSVAGRDITSIEIVRDLPVLALHGAHLTQVLAPLALTKCDASQYETTRDWARSLLDWLPDIAGFVYRCRHDEDELAWVLFVDQPVGPSPRAAGAVRALDDSLPLDAGAGLHAVKQVLHAHNATLA